MSKYIGHRKIQNTARISYKKSPYVFYRAICRDGENIFLTLKNVKPQSD